jgi:hypothetical protein
VSGLSFENYLRVEATGQRTVALKLVHVDMAGDLLAGVLLSQLVYWHSPNRETGEPRLTFEREGHRWVRKAYDEWHEECRLTAGQARGAVDRLRDRGLVESRVWKHRGTPTLHLRIVPEAFMAAFDLASSQVSPEMLHRANGLVAPNGSVAPDLLQGANGNAPQRKSEMRHSASPSMEEITSETTVQRETPLPPAADQLALAAQARPVEQVWEAWKESTGHHRAVLDAKRRRIIGKALGSHGLEVCLKAVLGWSFSPFHRGENENGRVYNGLDLLLRDAGKIEMFAGYCDGEGLTRPVRRSLNGDTVTAPTDLLAWARRGDATDGRALEAGP